MRDPASQNAAGCLDGESAWSLSLPDGETLRGYSRSGRHRLTGVFLHGFRSHCDGGKSRCLSSLAGRLGYPWLRFDQRGCGLSSGAFRAFTISGAVSDTGQVIGSLGSPPCVLVGSSLGALIALHVARSRDSCVAGLVLVAPALRFTEHFIHGQLEPREIEAWRRRGYRWLPDVYEGGCYRLDYGFCADALRYTEPPRALHCPVRVIHGRRDELLPVSDSERWLDGLDCPDKGLEIIDQGDHRLTEWSSIIARHTETLFNEVSESCA